MTYWDGWFVGFMWGMGVGVAATFAVFIAKAVQLNRKERKQ